MEGTVTSWEDVLAGRPAESVHLPLPPSAPLLRMRSEPCVCGGVVHADPLEPMSGVASHNRSNVHQAWRTENERVDSWTGSVDNALPEAARTPEHRDVSRPDTGGAPVKPNVCPAANCMTILPPGRETCRFHESAA